MSPSTKSTTLLPSSLRRALAAAVSPDRSIAAKPANSVSHAFCGSMIFGSGRAARPVRQASSPQSVASLPTPSAMLVTLVAAPSFFSTARN